jgi:hypothetical protein
MIGTGCDDFLDEKPDNRVDLDNLEKAAQLLTNAYSDAGYTFTDWMTDDVAYTRGVQIRLEHRQAYEWEDYTGSSLDLDNQDFYWFRTYQAIAHANEVLAILDKLPVVSEEDQARKRAVESEARLTRAYGHFMLVNLFGKHYDNVRSSADPGVPWVNEPETVFLKTYSRNSVKAVYDSVEADMLRGIELVDDSFFANSGKYHFNRNAALAFASRFYLYKGDFENCIKYSDMLLGSDPSPFVRDLTSPEFLALNSSGANFTQLYNSPDLQSNFLLMKKISLFHAPIFGHGPTVTTFGDLINANFFPGTSDEREFPAFVKGDNGFFPARYQFLFERSGLNSNVGQNYHIHIAFRGEEVLLNRAESLMEENRLDDALADLQVLVDRRYNGNPASLTIEYLRDILGVSGDPFFSDKRVVEIFLRFERRKEFIIQGLRWFDIKRLELEVTHDLIDGSIIELDDNDRRKVLQIPISAIEVGGLDPNPR